MKIECVNVLEIEVLKKYLYLQITSSMILPYKLVSLDNLSSSKISKE